MKAYFRLSLKYNDTTWWALQGNTVVQQAMPYYLSSHALVNWSDTKITDVRSLEHSGFIRSYAENYQFANDGYKMLAWIWNRYGVNAIAILYVEVLNTTTQTYEYSYQADLNFLQAAINRSSEGDIFTVDVAQRDIQEAMKSKEDYEYEIPVSVAPVKVNCRSMLVNGKIKFVTTWPRTPTITSTSSFPHSGFGYKIACTYVDKEVVPISGIVGNAPVKEGNEPTPQFDVMGQVFEERLASGGYTYTTDNNVLFEANVDLRNVKPRGNLPFYVENKSAVVSRYRVELGVWTPTSITAYRIVGTFDSPPLLPNVGQNFSIEIKFRDTGTNSAFTMAKGDKLVLEARLLHSDHYVAWENGALFEVGFQHLTNDFFVWGVPIYEIGRELISRMTAGKAVFTSDALTRYISYDQNYDCIPADLVLLSGDSIRFGADASIKIKWSDYVRSLAALAGLAYGVEGNVVRVEGREYFYDRHKQIADLGEVASLQIAQAGDLAYNLLKIGAEAEVSDDLNGRYEFNTTHQYAMQVLNTKKTLELVSPIRSDGWGIFSIWVRYAVLIDEKAKNDSKGDKQLFIIQKEWNAISGNIYNALYADKFSRSSVAAVPDGNRVMNIGLTPKRCLLRNSSFLRSLFYTHTSSDNVMTFLSGDRNTAFAAKLSTAYAIEEGKTVDVGQADTQRLFLPRVYEISTGSVFNYTQAWQANRNGYFRFIYKGRAYRGFPLESEISNASPQEYTYRLLAHPDDIDMEIS